MHLSSPGPEEDDKSEGPGVANLQRDRASGNALIKMFNKIFLKICIIIKTISYKPCEKQICLNQIPLNDELTHSIYKFIRTNSPLGINR